MIRSSHSEGGTHEVGSVGLFDPDLGFIDDTRNDRTQGAFCLSNPSPLAAPPMVSIGAYKY